MNNAIIAKFFEDIADLLEIKDDNPFRIRAYRKAAQNINGLSEEIEDVANEGRLEELPGIGTDLAAKILEILKTGRLKHYEKLKRQVPQPILEFIKIPGIGPKTAKLLYEKLKAKSIFQLEKLAKAHKVRVLPGLKEKTEENILRGIVLVKKRAERMTLSEARLVAEEAMSGLKKVPEVDRMSTAGSLRRMKETVRDIDILVTSSRPKKVMDSFVKLPIARDVLARGQTKSSVLTEGGAQVDLRVVSPESFGAALVYFTGSQAHNIRMRAIAKKMGLKVNEYGVFTEKTNKRLAGKEEAGVYKALKLEFIPPELREDRGEIEAASKGTLPDLVKMQDIKGDLHVHSEWSDGSDSIIDIAKACAKRGYRYVAVTDHSQSLRVAGGLSERDVAKKLKEIERTNRRLKGFRVLSGVETEIFEDGSLDYREDVLKTFDVVVAAIHSGFKQSKEKLTSRIVKAMESGLVHIIAHPTGRHMGAREPYGLDFDEIFKTAKATKTALEINAFPERLDLDDINSRAAMETHAKVAICTDAHSIDHLAWMELGVAVARRAWLTRKDILNTLDTGDLLKFLKK